jgi:hypothetical protein
VRVRFFAVCAVLACVPPALAEEGMWLFTDFPAEQVHKAHGFRPDKAWLDRVRLGSVRLAGGCSASFVSPRGLVMTNHHCIRSCIEDLSTPKQDLLERGFLARADKDERRCPKVEANQLQEVTDVTDQVRKATAGAQGPAFAQALKAEQTRIESACAAKDPKIRCDVVTLFHGGRYHLYRYRRFQDVRLAWAPEFPMAAFGGDPDNFNFPRYGFDAAFLRVYEDDKPAATPDHLRWAKTGAKQGDLTFVSGHPGGTERVQTVEQLAFQRDVVLPYYIALLAELRGVLLEYQKGGAERFRTTRARLRSVENSLKALRGRHAYLADPDAWAAKVREDQALRTRVEADPKLAAQFGAAWPGIAQATSAHRRIFLEHRLLEAQDAFNSELFGLARSLLRAAAEREKPDRERLREYTTAQLPALEQRLFRDAPIPREVEALTLGFSLRRLREALGADHPLVQRILGKDAPEDLARRLVSRTRLGDPKIRRQLYEGGQQAVDASKDPMIVLARAVDAEARGLRRVWEDEVDAALKRNHELLNQAHVAVHGTSGYPDATFTLRLSYGQVQGWKEGDRKVPALTTFGGLFERHTGKFPFAVAPSWLKARPKLDPATPMNMASTHDIIGGNSGSPMVDRDGRVVGLVFDGNLHSLGGRYGYDPERNRAVAVHGVGILEGLRKVYGAARLADEIEAAAK